MKTNTIRCGFIALLTLASLPCAFSAEEASMAPEKQEIYGEHGDEASLARASRNPVANLISLPLQNNFLFQEDTGDLMYNLNVQPVIPFNLNDDWNLITRTIVPFFALESAPSGFDSVGLCDISTSLFFSPANSRGLMTRHPV